MLLDPDARDVLEERVADLSSGSPVLAPGRGVATARRRRRADPADRSHARTRALKQRLRQHRPESAEAVEQKPASTPAGATGREMERASRRRRRDRWIVAVAIVLLAGALSGRLPRRPRSPGRAPAPRRRCARCSAASARRSPCSASPTGRRRHSSSSSRPRSYSACVDGGVRTRSRSPGIVACGVAAVVLALLLPGIRDSAWRTSSRGRNPGRARRVHDGERRRVHAPQRRRRQPVLVGPDRSASVSAALRSDAARPVWQRWIPQLHISRIHKFESTSSSAARTRDVSSRPGLAPLTGRERWRRACTTPAAGGGAIDGLEPPALGREPVLHRRRARVEHAPVEEARLDEVVQSRGQRRGGTRPSATRNSLKRSAPSIDA